MTWDPDAFREKDLLREGTEAGREWFVTVRRSHAGTLRWYLGAVEFEQDGEDETPRRDSYDVADVTPGERNALPRPGWVVFDSQGPYTATVHPTGKPFQWTQHDPEMARVNAVDADDMAQACQDVAEALDTR